MNQYVTFSPCRLSGEIKIPPSKSYVHRAVICAALSRGICKISPVALSEDIRATISCANALGAKCSIENDVLTVDARKFGTVKEAVLDCGESGSTLRFFIPIAAAIGADCTFTGRGRLPSRPIGIYLDSLPKFGVKCISHGGLPLHISGKLTSGRYELPGNVSSQFITGFLLALPLLDGDSDIILTTPMESAGYIDITLEVMSKFGISILRTENGYKIHGGQSYSASSYQTEGDWSQAAFFLCAGAINGSVGVHGLSDNSVQGDRAVADILKSFGADIIMENGAVTASHSELNACEIDAAQIPDLVPVLAVTAALCSGTTIIRNCERLRIKESDRLRAIANAINTIGGKAQETQDSLIIHGVKRFTGCAEGETVDGCNDHRILMSMAIAACGCSGEITVSDAMSINKSYPDFYTDYNSLGGKANVRSMGK